MQKRSLPLFAAIVAVGFSSTPLKADINGFNGPWDPLDNQGHLLNYEGGPLINDATFEASLSSNNSVLTLDFDNPRGGFSLFSDFIDPSLLPSGTISYNWSVDFLQTGNWLLETGVVTTFPGGDNFGLENAGTYTGTATLNYTTGNYFSFGNIGFGSGAHEAVLTLSNFQYLGEAEAPEPATAFYLFGGAFSLAVAARFRKHRA